MSKNTFQNCKITAIKSVVPKDFIDIDDEIRFFDNSQKKLDRAKKMLGYGRRYIADKNTTAVDLSYQAGNALLNELNIDRKEIDTLLFLSQYRDYSAPASANILHGKLDLDENCAALDLSQGCSGYVYGLWIAYSLIQSASSKKILLLTSDTSAKNINTENRLIAPIFGDSASATLIEYTDIKTPSYFILGSKGKDWDKLITPAGGARIPVDKEILEKTVKDKRGNTWKLNQLIMQGIDVFGFTMDYAPKNIQDTLEYAGLSAEDIELYVLHQANKQIVESIAQKAQIPLEKTPVNTFSDYANCACNSVGINITQNCKDIKGNILLCGYGIGLSWASAITDITGLKNLGIDIAKSNKVTTQELKEYWYNRFITKGE